MKLKRKAPKYTPDEINDARNVLLEAGYTIVKNGEWDVHMKNAYARGYNNHVMLLKDIIEPSHLQGYPEGTQ